MRNKYLRSTIIVMIQLILPLFGFLLFASQLLDHPQLINQLALDLKSHQSLFFIMRILFYMAFYFIWPVLINHQLAQKQLSVEPWQKQTAISARWYLLAMMLFFEILNYWR
ncbi:hypothetical protein Lsan_2898 [Legionella santicrucis]|uniref:Uncharacterized protein n=1 Tax=Legionella santicrucis TaxID=45074 RepID=A0A0W0YIP9_9GAMM|nr:hypothetical protein [Legionella santicrucis]KTD56738.1 hypothetical protein Lsan_2898 [Legionella santicrucis]